MKNAVYYILLCVISTILFIYTLWKKKDKKLLVLYFSAAGFTYFLEYFVLVIFQGYAYFPWILKNEYFDNIMGAVVSDAFTIPMTSTFVAGLKLNFKKGIFLAAAIMVIEIIFVRTKIYEHYWWNYVYTFVGAVAAFHYSQKWLSIIHKPINHLIRFANLFFFNLFVHSSIVFILVAFFNLYFYNIHWFNNPTRGHVTFSTMYIIIITVIFTALIVFRVNWFWIFIGLLLPSIIDIVLLKMNILYMSDKWSLMNFLVLRFLILISLYLYDKHLLSEDYY